MVAHEALKHDTIIVLVTGIPIIVVTDPTVTELVGVVPYRSMKDPTGFDGVHAALADLRGAESMAPVALPAEEWSDSRGRKLTGSFISATDTDVSLKLESGKISTIPLERLSEQSQSRVRELSGP